MAGLQVGDWRTLLSTPALFVISVLLGLFLGPIGVLAIAATGVVGLFRALRSMYKLVAVGVPEDEPMAIVHFFGNAFMAFVGWIFAAWAANGFARGRQLRRRGEIILPLVEKSPDWAPAGPSISAAYGFPEGLADQWRENGRTEHASVAAFARLTLDLIALGAPSDLVASSNQDALDEIRHTELCFGLARAIDGRVLSPAAFPEVQRVAPLPRHRTLALAKLAVDSLIDGALHEGVSARVIAKLAQRCDVPEIRAILKEIAADEGRHSANGWAAVRWCLREGGAPVGSALLGALRGLPPEVAATLPEGARDGSWERFGIHGLELERQEYAAALAHLRQRVRALVSAPATLAA